MSWDNFAIAIYKHLSHHAVLLFKVKYKWFFDNPFQGDLDFFMACVYRFYKYSMDPQTGASDYISIYLITDCEGVFYIAADLVHGAYVAFFGRFSGFIYIVHFHLFVECSDPWFFVVGYQTYLEAYGFELFHKLDSSGCSWLVVADQSVVYVE